jgi:hypothetical protein
MAGIGKALAVTPARKARLPNFVVMTTSPMDGFHFYCLAAYGVFAHPSSLPG